MEENQEESVWKRRFDRERKLRKNAELLLEEKSRDLYELNLNLGERVEVATEEIRQNNEELMATLDQVAKQKEDIRKSAESVAKSIDAALRIQQGILPTQETLAKYFPENFVLNIPRNIVSGDFFWTSELNGQRIFILADCTGHGVPGAFMSLIGYSLLNNIIEMNRIYLPHHILFYLNLFLVNYFKNKKNEVPGGMDAAVLLYDPSKKTLRYSGARLPLYICRQGVLTEIAAEKQSIGGSISSFTEEKNFGMHSCQIQAGDQIFLSSDGFQDQFGGPDDRKFLRKNLKRAFEKASLMPLGNQSEFLTETFHNWRGQASQIDDILVCGLKF